MPRALPATADDVAVPPADPRQRLLIAARDVVAESGWRDAQIALIAHRAGVATGSVYRHFESKAHLYAQVLAMVSERELAVTRRFVDAPGSAAQRLLDLVFMFSLRALQGRRLAYALIAEPCDPQIDVARLQYRAALAAEVARLIRQGVDGGEFVDVDPTLAAGCVTGAFMEALVGPLAPPSQAAAAERQLAQDIAALAVRQVVRRPTAALGRASKGLG